MIYSWPSAVYLKYVAVSFLVYFKGKITEQLPGKAFSPSAGVVEFNVSLSFQSHADLLG